MGEDFKESWYKIFFLGLRQFVLAILIVFGVLVFAMAGVTLLRDINPEMAYMLAIIGPYSMVSWLILLSIIGWYPIVLAVWTWRDAVKFKNKGVHTLPFLWAIGVVLPTVFIVFPVYYIIRDIIWKRKLQNDNASASQQETQSDGKNRTRILKEIILSAIAVAFVVYIVVMATDLPNKLNKEKTKEQVAKIHNTKLTMDDVMGVNLPPDPGSDADKTIEGIDANKNGIRDDVELAIFKEYPDSAKTRAVLLQYALALQMEMTLPILNMETATASVEDNETRAFKCIWSISSRDDMDKFTKETERNENFIKERQINTELRKKYAHNFYEHIGSYMMSRGGCDIDISTLPN